MMAREIASPKAAHPPALSCAPFALGLALALVALFPRVILGWETFFYRDFGVLAYPTIYYDRLSFWRGELPLWNPLSNCGVPFLAQWGTMVLYPFSLIYLLLPLPWSLNIFCLAHLFWAGLGMHALAKRWTGNSLAASVAGFGFVFNGVTLSSLMWPNYTVALGWMPWVVLRVEEAWQKRTPRSLALAAVVSALQLLSGVPEIVLLTWALLLGIGLMQFCSEARGFGRWMGQTLLVILLVSGLAAIQLIPFVDLLLHSQRNATSATLKWALPPWGLGNLLVPLFRCALSPQGIFFQLGQDFFASTYLGIIQVALALLAIGVRRERRIWLLAGLSAGALLLALGEYGGVYRLVRLVIPSVGFMRYPVKFILLLAFTLPLLSACGVEAIARQGFTIQSAMGRRLGLVTAVLVAAIAGTVVYARYHLTPYDLWSALWPSAAWRVVFLVLAVAALGLMAAPRADGKLGAVALCALLVADAFIAVPQKYPRLPSRVMAPGIWELQNKTKAPQFGEGRAFISPEAERRLLVSQVRDLEADFLGKRLALWSHLNLLELIPKVNGSSTLQIREEKELETRIYNSTNLDLGPLRRFLNVVSMTAPGQVVEWSPSPDPMPLISTGQRPIFAEDAVVFEHLTNSNFAPAREVYLPTSARALITATNGTDATVISQSVGAHRLHCMVQATQPSLVVIAQSFYHPWHAYVDGKPAALWRANAAFQAVEVPSGKHQLEVTYQDRGFWTGLAVSALTLALCVGLWCWPVRETAA